MEIDNLKQNLPFIVEMIESVKTVEFRQKWQAMKDLIESNKLTSKQIETIELNIKKAKQLKEQYKTKIVAPATNNEVKCSIKTDNSKTNESIKRENNEVKCSIKTDNSKTNESIKSENNEANIKQQKELRRLHENIVKDNLPLPSKRRSALKRSYRDSLEFLLDKSPTRNLEKKVKPESVEKLNNSTKRKSIDVNTSKDESTSKSFEQEAQKEVPKVENEILNSHIAKTQINESKKTNDSKKSSINRIKRKIQKQQKKDILKKRSRLNLLTKGATFKKTNQIEDDEWEDMEEPEEDPKPEIIRMKIPKTQSETIVEKESEISKCAEESNIVIAAGTSNSYSVKKSTEKSEKRNRVVIKKVQNMSYIICKSGFIFKCLVDGCKFFTMENPAFVDHIENQHLTVKWDGHCEICNDKVEQTRSIIFELMHMRENHVLKEETKKSTNPSSTVQVPNKKVDIKEEVKNDKNSLKIDATMKIVDQKSEKLKQDDKTQESIKIIGKKIKVKQVASLNSSQASKYQFPVETMIIETTSDYSRSSSSQSDNSHQLNTNVAANENLESATSKQRDKLSNKEKPEDKILKHFITKPSQMKESKSIVQPSKEENNEKKIAVKESQSQIKIASSEESVSIQRQKSGDVQKEIAPDLLRPWLKRKIKKYLMPTTRLLDNEAAIVSTYKCMSSKCSFYTSDQKLFNSHLKYHAYYLSGDRDYMNCAYCDYIFFATDGTTALIEHIDNEHCYDKYQCKYCFYRSCVSLNVINHQTIFHPMKPKSVYELPNIKNRDYAKELDAIKKSRTKYVPPLVCVKCGAKFYLFPKLSAHMQSHGMNIKTKCTKCSKVTDMSNIHTHFINCHKLGLYQCVFCNFGTNNFDTIVNHIGINHASKPPMYCERSCEKHDQVNPSVIDSMSLKYLTQKVDHRIIKIPIVDEKALKNLDNVGDLGGNYKIKSVPFNKAQNHARNQVEVVVKTTPTTSTPNVETSTLQVVPKTPKEKSFVGFKRINLKSTSPTVQATSPNLIKVVKKNVEGNQISIPNEKSSGLQIKRVYSLNNLQ